MKTSDAVVSKQGEVYLDTQGNLGLTSTYGGITVNAFNKETSLYEVMQQSVAWNIAFQSVIPPVQEKLVGNTLDAFKAGALQAVSRLTFTGMTPERIAQETGLTEETVEQYMRHHRFHTGQSNDDPSYDE